MLSGLEIAQAAQLRPIAEVAADAGIEPGELRPYGTTPGQGVAVDPGPPRRPARTASS